MSIRGASRSGFVAAREPTLHYIAHGDPAAPPVVLVHGMRDHAHSWDKVAAQLADRFHVIAIDLRGHGDSGRADASGYTLAAYVLDIADLVEALELPTFGLIGHSLGGAIAIRYAGAFPDRVRALCAIEGVELPIMREHIERPTPFPVKLRAWADGKRAQRNRRPHVYRDLAAAEVRMKETQPELDADTIAHLVRYGLKQDINGEWRWKYDNEVRLRAPDDALGRDLDETLAAIACPTLLAYGADSWIAPPDADRLSLIGDHRKVMFPAAGHWLHHQVPDAFVEALIPFLETAKD